MKPMRKILDDLAGDCHLMDYGDDGMSGYLRTPFGHQLKFIASWGEGWDHVSVSRTDRCPTWEEMAWVKDRFFEPEEAAMQLHPPQSQYVNRHPFCLHIWRPHRSIVPLPPIEFVG
jgi:hypothetical protein